MKRILIVKLSSLGDLFHALPAVHALKEGLNAEIDWVTQPEYEELARCFDDVAHVIPFPRRNLRTRLIPFLRRLRERHYDYVIDLQGLMKSALITPMARGGRKIGPSASREGAHLFYHERAGKKNKERHAAEELLDVVRHLNLPVPDALPFPVTFPAHAGLGPGLHIALCPCSRAAGKDWPEDRFVEMAKDLLQSPGTVIHLVGSPNDRATCQRIAMALGPTAQNHAGQTTLLELGGLLKAMDLLITVDSGPMHMAAAIGTPTLALFGPTSPLRTGPYGEQHRVIESPFHLENKKLSKKTRQTDMRYIESISVEEVTAAAQRMLAK
jgi:lipopolysaccharide heptosyltransferase I